MSHVGPAERESEREPLGSDISLKSNGEFSESCRLSAVYSVQSKRAYRVHTKETQSESRSKRSQGENMVCQMSEVKVETTVAGGRDASSVEIEGRVV